MYQPPSNYPPHFGYGARQPRPLPYEPTLPSEPQPTNTSRKTLSPVDENAATSLLKHLDKQELQGLLDNETKLQDLVDDLSQVKNIQVERETLLASNKSVAEYNLSFQPRLEKLKGEVASGHEEIKRLQGVAEEDRAQLLLHSNEQSVDMLLALLQTECAKTEEDSEQLAENFCDKKIEVEQFVEEFIQFRTLAHLRRVKCDKMAELMVNPTPVPPPRTVPPKNFYNSSSTASAYPANTAAAYPANSTNAYPVNNTASAAPYPATSSFMMMPEPFLPR